MTGAARRGRSQIAGAVAVCGVLAIAPTAASAALVTGGGTQFSYTAALGELNDVAINVKGFSDGSRYVHVGHRNSTPLLYEDTVCEEDPIGGVRCPIAGPVTVVANLGDLNDQLSISGTFGLITSALVDGGPGGDALDSATTRVAFSGGEGDDRLAADGRARANPPGAPVGGDVFSGGQGLDSTCFAQGGFRTDRMTITLDGAANDGAPGEGDNVMPDVEEICGGQADDTIVGTAAPNVLHGEGGNDRVEGGPGADDLYGSCGDDTVVGGPGADSLHDDPTSAVICIGGNDSLDARDGERDTIFCSGGGDTVHRDEVDVIGVLPTLCERQVLALPKIKGKKLRAKKHKLKLKIACPAGGAKCKGRVKVRTARRVKLGGKRRKFTIAKGRYKVRAGKTKRAKAKLTRAGRKAAERRGAVKVKVQLRTPAGTKITRKALLK